MVDIPPEVKAQVDAMVTRVGLKITDAQRAMLYEVAPSVLESVKRLRGEHAHHRQDEPANTFRFS